MENKDPKSWSSAHIYQSQWLQTTISDLDEKLDAMKTILNGDNSPNQESMDCKWRGDLIQMLDEFGQSYRVLALAYNQLKFNTSNGTFNSGSLSSSGTSNTICAICNKRPTGNLEDKKLNEGWNHHPKYSAEHSNIKFDGSNLGFDQFNKQGDECREFLSADPCNMKFKSELECRDTQMEDRMNKISTTENVLMKIEDSELNQRNEDPSMINFKFDNMWSTLKYQITKLTEDNMHQLVELVQRNDEKRETIRRLQFEVETLKCENKALQTSLRHSNADSECDQPQISRAGGRSMGNLFRGCSP
ncbi:hypothetical protein AAZX31_19G090300 [Glycine max]|uniref:NAB domain-containing protein n=1 Tax=Glycine max TaxID=3847 RepID=K7MXM1_SOYBN|nr:uncharacterized protein LOC102661501 [Glycine max]KAG4915552.1 hypothetical protein JHK87_053109 [Glycine soja]KAG4912602.1 hypothetical protein JHK86_053035 [Glycine max]KAG4927416.1 hypothetical protein JHK85_053902 [Glycine max]KAG5083025.1 hypothetical protein JHK84_053063 [Glycine max]KAG5085791.1 hypothetical protein JHK82_053188 [Glycine max]|eukprot:XP_006604187.1 uncharacterized protein LOC102661501 [Glycine max]